MKYLSICFFLFYLGFMSCSTDKLIPEEEVEEVEEFIVECKFERTETSCSGDVIPNFIFSLIITTTTSGDSERVSISGLDNADVILDEDNSFGPDPFGKYSLLEIQLSDDNLFVHTEELGFDLFTACDLEFVRKK